MSNRSETMFVHLLFIYIAGILCAYLFPSLFAQHLYAGLAVVLFIGMLALNIGYLRYKVYRYKLYWSPLLYLLIFFAAAWTYLIQVQTLQTRHFSRQQAKILKVVIDDEPQRKGNLFRFKAKVINTYGYPSTMTCIGKILVTVPIKNDSTTTFAYGDVLLVPANYQTISSPKNPGEFDYKSWLATHQVYHQLYLPPEKIYRLKQQAGNPLLSYAIKLRKQQVAFFEKTLHSPEAIAMASTLILGYRADLSKETLAAYSKTGTIHALSVSGMHVGIIYIVLHALLQFMDKSRWLKVSRTVLIISLIWFYALLTGLSPSVLRSAFMLSIFIIGKTMNRRSNSYNTMAFSAVALLIYQPLLLFDLGFQLSYLSVFGLIYLQPLLYQLVDFKWRWADKLWNYASLSIAAQLATFPLSVYYFHQFPVYFLFSNFFILLPVTLMMYLGLLMLLMKLELLAPLLEYTITFMNKGLSWIAELPFATISAIWLRPLELLLLSAVVIFSIQSFLKAQKYSLFIAASTLLWLQSSLSFRQLQRRQQQKTIVFKLYKHQAVAYIRGNHALLYTNLEPENPAYQYTIKPCLDLHQVSYLQIKNAHPDFRKIKHL